MQPGRTNPDAKEKEKKNGQGAFLQFIPNVDLKKECMKNMNLMKT